MSDTSWSDTREGEAQVEDYFALLKPRVMSLVVFTAFVGLIAAPVTPHPLVAFSIVLFIAIGAGASGALNMWWDSDIDAVMKRTRNRPIVAGRVPRDNALIFGLWLSGFAVVMLALVGNLASAALLAFTIFFYAVIYSMWLKRSTPQNIVIGGASGAFPPMIGWLAATGSITIEPVLMFLLIFMWTPPHFWALSLFMNDDYTKAGVPMLTVVKGHKTTRNHIFGYSLILAPSAFALAFTSAGGFIYLVTALILNALLLYKAYAVWKRADQAAEADQYKVEKSFFKFSILYLFLHFTALLADALVQKLGLLTIVG